MVRSNLDSAKPIQIAHTIECDNSIGQLNKDRKAVERQHPRKPVEPEKDLSAGKVVNTVLYTLT